MKKSMKKILLFLVMVVAVFLVSCAPEIPQDELAQELEQLSDDDLDTLIEETSNDDARAVAGQAFLSKKGYTWTNRVSRSDILIAAQGVKIGRLEKQLQQGIETSGQTQGVTPIEWGQPVPGDGIENPGEAEGFNPEPELPGKN